MERYALKSDEPVIVADPQEQPEPAPPYSALSNREELLPAAPPPRDFVLWSLFNAIFLNPLCLGFLALVFSVKARDRKMLQDMNGAGHYASTAKALNIASSIIGIISTIFFFVFVLIPSYKSLMRL
ncbi:dispanin subfamily A member 2b-like [Rhinatrema bivittatum]|uniref:dispanin subfamily A member 2b-like n=1 Tax=Rhinatrema bivittatum TaxID=194408 RepID=UPI0011270141|nr:dispanin subfamily A member 2b-like [Rhinatrema bivittatum]